MAKQGWEDAKLSPAERQAKVRAEQQDQIAKAKKRTEEVTARYEKAKVSRSKN